MNLPIAASGLNRGIAFLELDSMESWSTALRLDSAQLNDRKISVSPYKERKECGGKDTSDSNVILSTLLFISIVKCVCRRKKLLILSERRGSKR